MIAIIDDDEAVRVAIENLVRSLGFEAITFGSAEEFLSSPAMHEASCLITDVQMPGMSGIDLQARLTAEQNSVPIIFITAFPEERIRQHACSAGAIGFLSKPFEGRSLIDCIDKAVSS